MNQQDEINALLPEWLSEQFSPNNPLSQSETDLGELLDDYAHLAKAIRYWDGKSEERVEEFRYLAKELQSEIDTMLTQYWR